MWPFTWWSSKFNSSILISKQCFMCIFRKFAYTQFHVFYIGSCISYPCHFEGNCGNISIKGKREGLYQVYNIFSASCWKCCSKGVGFPSLWPPIFFYCLISSPLIKNELFLNFYCFPLCFLSLCSYVNRKGWQHYFKSYCIPEDLIPRILSPAYFHHYNAQPQLIPPENGINSLSLTKHEQVVEKDKENEGEQLVLGMGPVQRSFWRLSRLVPLEGLRRQLSKHQRRQVSSIETNSVPDSLATTLTEEEEVEPQSLEIQEGSDSISLKPLAKTDTNGKTDTKSNTITGDKRKWRRVPYLPSYVPFGQVYTLD